MAIKLYWCRGAGETHANRCNFGDYLSPLLVEMLSRKRVIYAPVQKADMMAIGTIMGREQKARGLFGARRLHVWGTGTHAAGQTASARHHYHAVRGHKTAEQIDGVAEFPALGDPGLLVALWWDGRPVPTKRYRLGIIPHYLDQDHPQVKQWAALPGTHLIDVHWPVEDVLRAVQMCSFILSSSLHGLIVADAFNVPNRRLTFSQGMISDYKFVDYYSAFGLEEPPPLSASWVAQERALDAERLVGDYQRPGLEVIQRKLIEAFPRL